MNYRTKQFEEWTSIFRFSWWHHFSFFLQFSLISNQQFLMLQKKWYRLSSFLLPVPTSRFCSLVSDKKCSVFCTKLEFFLQNSERLGRSSYCIWRQAQLTTGLPLDSSTFLDLTSLDVQPLSLYIYSKITKL